MDKICLNRKIHLFLKFSLIFHNICVMIKEQYAIARRYKK